MGKSVAWVSRVFGVLFPLPVLSKPPVRTFSPFFEKKAGRPSPARPRRPWVCWYSFCCKFFRLLHRAVAPTEKKDHPLLPHPPRPSDPSNRSPGGPGSYSASAQAGGCFPVGARPPGRSGSAATPQPNPEVHAGTTPPTRRSDTAAQVVPPSLLPQKRPLPDNSIVFRASAQAGGCFPVGARPPGRSGSAAAAQPYPLIHAGIGPHQPAR